MTEKLQNPFKINELITAVNSLVDSEGSSTPDNLSITQNTSSNLQAVGVINQNATTTAIKTWTGTKAQYNAIATKDNNTLYNITDDESDIYDRVSGVINHIYPIGSIYLTVSNDNPATLLGLGTWQKVASGRVLQGADNDHTAGTTIEAGLPNITGDVGKNSGIGHVSNTSFGLSVHNSETSGAFYVNNNCEYTATRQVQQGNNGKSLGFDASRSSSIYGNSNTVQPPAYVVNIWQRIA